MTDLVTVVDRKSSDSTKWHKYHSKDIIPMWVADMDFMSPPEIIEALHQRVAHGVFGYSRPSEELVQTVMNHLYEVYHWTIEPEWLVWLPGLVTGINVACRSIGTMDDAVITTVPAYPPFLTAPRFSGRTLITSAMVHIHDKINDRWEIDFDQLEWVISANSKMFILCNPHNPTGRVFNSHELAKVAEICLNHKMVICSDEIHCDLVLDPDCKHIPLATLSKKIADQTITLMAPSKTYNIPGLGCSFAIISNPALRRRFKNAMNGIVPHVNTLGFTAAQAAYCYGKPWLSKIIAYLRENRDLVFHEINRVKGLHTAPVEATYLAWIDTRDLKLPAPQLFFEEAGVGLSDGADFGAPEFVRLNFACPRQLLQTAIDRMKKAVDAISAKAK